MHGEPAGLPLPPHARRAAGGPEQHGWREARPGLGLGLAPCRPELPPEASLDAVLELSGELLGRALGGRGFSDPMVSAILWGVM